MSKQDLGKLISVHGISAALLQRSVIVIIVSLFFALAMLVGWFFTQKFLFLLLAVAFLIVKLVTLFSLIAQRKNVLSVYENRFVYNKIACRFDEIVSVNGFEVLMKSGETIVLNESIGDVEVAIELIQKNAQA
jgi:hypothetical protein